MQIMPHYFLMGQKNHSKIGLVYLMNIKRTLLQFKNEHWDDKSDIVEVPKAI